MATEPQTGTTAPDQKPRFRIQKQGKSRWWEVWDPDGKLVCLTVYKKGAVEVVRRLAT